MSIETTFERIATALESLAKSNQALLDLQSGKPVTTSAPAEAQTMPAGQVEPAPAAPQSPPPAAPAAPAETATTPSAPAAPAPTQASEPITMEQLNEACGKAAEKVGDGGPVFAILQKYNASSIPQLKPEDYAAVMNEVSQL